MEPTATEPTRKRVATRIATNDLATLATGLGIDLCVTTEQAAALLGVAEQTMRRWSSEDSGPIRPRRLGSRLRWSVADINKLLAGTAA